MKEPKENNAGLWLMGGISLCALLFGWWICWRTDATGVAYVITPVLILGALVIGGLVNFFFQMRGLQTARWGWLAPCGVLLCGTGIAIASGLSEIEWGAPRLTTIEADALVFEDRQRQKFSIKNVQPEGYDVLRRKVDQRMTKVAIHLAQALVVMDGLAENAAGFEVAEKEARENRYGIWGGGSYEKDMELLKGIRERVGDVAVKETLAN
ncbi:MAG TPA: hypothetical protein VG796_14715 [Verrucomicrobiales bacterium]|nr:hypothetical protein [Verrucomicrobiales bacterium]